MLKRLKTVNAASADLAVVLAMRGASLGITSWLSVIEILSYGQRASELEKRRRGRTLRMGEEGKGVV